MEDRSWEAMIDRAALGVLVGLLPSSKQMRSIRIRGYHVHLYRAFLLHSEVIQGRFFFF